MRVLFKAGKNLGGIDAHGFIEAPEGQELTGEELVYSRQSYTTLHLHCKDIVYRSCFDVVRLHRPQGEESVEPASARESISATGIIGRSRWGMFSLCLLGCSNEHTEIAVHITTGDTEEAWLGGSKSIDDLDLDVPEGFSLDVVVSKENFDQVLMSLQKPNASLMLTVAVDRFPKFFTTWSPSISDGRVIKYLESKADVENADEIVDGFLEGTDVEGYNRYDFRDRTNKPVSISVHTILTDSKGKPKADTEDYLEEEKAEEATPVMQPTVVQETKNIYQTSKLQIWINILFAVIIALLYVSL